MGLADLFRPKYRHSDVKVRAEAVRALTHDDAAILEQIARTDRDIGVRRIAIEKIETPDVLAQLGQDETERSLRELIQKRAAELWLGQACGNDADRANTALSGMIKLGDQDPLVEVVVRAQLAAVRKRAFGEIRDPRALALLAKSDADQDLRLGAVSRIDDGDVLRALAVDTTLKEVGLAAVDKLDDIDRLENVAQKAKNKAVRQRARKIVTEIQAAERAKRTPVVPDEVKRRKAEKAQLIRETEGWADSFDFANLEAKVSAAEVAWMKLGGTDDGDERFQKAVDRFWKRKEIHESQARSADELRAIEREAAREKERRAAEKAAAAAKPADEVVAEAKPAEPDPVREAREAEAKARREERDRRKAEDDAKRAAREAERAAKQKEDAERGAAIAASLEALIGDMEALASGDGKDMRGIDRLLSSAAKAFEGIGKVQGPQRDALADRYSAVRGKLVVKANEHREAEDYLRWMNVPKAEALIQTAKEFAEQEPTPELGNKLRQLQALWKEVGPMPSRRSKELWEQFKVACDAVYEKVKVGRQAQDAVFAEVVKAKEALIAEAESLADSTDFAATAGKLKELQAKWKDSGHLPRKQGDELWKRFRAACDKFFERRKPMLEAKHAEEGQNLAKKQALIARAHEIANKAGEGTWGKAIGEIKDLQQQWKEIGYVPRRDADAVYKAFRAACDALFQKRDQARDAEANAHRAEVDALRAEIEAVRAGGDDVVTRAIAVRAKASELGVLGAESVAMVQHLIEHHADAVRGTELDPAQLRARRDKLIARVEELMPKEAPVVDAGAGDVAAQLKQAMQKNAFGSLRFSGRDPVEVVEELRASWAEIGPILDESDRAQQHRFEEITAKVLDASGAKPRERGGEAGEGGEVRRRRRDRNAHQAPASTLTDPALSLASVVATPAAVPEPSPITVVPDANASALAAIATADEVTSVGSSIPTATHDAITQPARLPPEVPVGVAEAAPQTSEPAVEPARPKSTTTVPPMDAVDTGWDLGDDDPTAGGDDDVPSSNEMAGDGSVEGDGLDQVD